ncbi:MAG: transcription termination/antitermination protein NusA [Candidatus Zixiibacteriota bacterium]|nr:MAG: transcription termination/antitermination protein NusA [candidate division Zixibacteria bacterium]
MSFEVLETLNQIAREKNLELDYVIETLKSALLVAARKKFGTGENLQVELDQRTGEITVTAIKKVVEKVEDPTTEISVGEAKKYDEKAEADDEMEIDIPFEDFGRNAIIAAKQMMTQKVREAEREKIYEEYEGRLGELVTGTVQQIDKGNIIVNLGRGEGIIPLKEQIRREKYRQGERVRAIITDAQRTAKGPQITLSRASPEFLLKLFELEVPEIAEKIIEVKAVAREPGERSKVAVSSLDSRVDPVGACVGVKGMRVQNIVRELSNERIDIVQWSPQPTIFVTKALAPSKIVDIDLFPEENRMTVVVDDEKLSLAIGKAGQNARLAAKLTSWKINILSETEYKAIKKAEEEEKIDIEEMTTVGKKIKSKLIEEGIETVQELLQKSKEELLAIEGIGPKTLDKLLKGAENLMKIRQAENEKEEQGKAPAETGKQAQEA